MKKMTISKKMVDEMLVNEIENGLDYLDFKSLNDYVTVGFVRVLEGIIDEEGDIEIETVMWTGKNKFNRLIAVIRKKRPQLIAYSENPRTALNRFMEGNPIERAAKRMNLPYICFNRTKIRSRGSRINPKFFVAP